MRQSKQVSILCDTNILIYYMLCTPRFIKDVMKLFERCVEREVKLSCASLSLKVVFYFSPERFKERFMNDESMVGNQQTQGAHDNRADWRGGM